MSGPVTPSLSPAERARLAKKQALAQEYAQARAGQVSMAVFQRDFASFMAQSGSSTRASAVITPRCIIDPNTGQCAVPTSNAVSLTQQPQANFYYCGPATAAEVLGVHGVSKTQAFLAGSSYLQTDSRGETPWNPYLMGPTLNTLIGTTWYGPVDGSAVGGGFSTATWESDLTFDVDHGWAVAGNIVEYANTDPHLVGHPRTQTIYHWIGIYGYASSGDATKYADSISGDSWIWSWAVNVPAYSSFSSTSMTTLLNQRGFVW